ncbi:unnamed protein product [Lactuca virosa]|uniref:GATA-type domain-containing protein n=1 Tax=Lactuca virosa TaxID=75947 RepID=A0AAU9NV20_9ASTR|nr:unnamed protein product [Lactuca virosa]
MDAQDKSRMYTDADYYPQVYDDDDYLGDILNILDYPVETLEGDALVEDWAEKLGPIPSEVFREILPPPVSNVNGGGGGGGTGGSADSFPESCLLKDTPILYEEEDLTLKKSKPRSFEAPSPDSVLERRMSSSAGKTISFGTEIAIPVRTRTKRARSTLTESPWSKSTLPIPLQKVKEKKKRRNFGQQQNGNNENKKCSHCEITKTPQWREGPMGPKTLCNACGVRYRSGRLFPEYRPAASPSFVPALHSNSHRKVVEMRMKGGGVNDDYFKKKVWSSNLIDTS